MPRPPAGDFDYDRLGGGYAAVRQADPRIAAVVHAALGAARTVLNVGAGAGSYEPGDRLVIAVEPSQVMRRQRPVGAAPVVAGIAERLPFADASFDAAMATVTVHQWPDLRAGLAEMRRVARGPVVILTFDGAVLRKFWLTEYFPRLIEVECRRYPDMATLSAGLGGHVTVTPVAVPAGCTDGFGEAFFGRPERLLDPAVRAAQSAWVFVEPADLESGLARLRADLDSGVWDARYGALRSAPTFAASLRVVLSTP